MPDVDSCGLNTPLHEYIILVFQVLRGYIIDVSIHSKRYNFPKLVNGVNSTDVHDVMKMA